MAYDEDLAARIREVVAPEPGISERRMFGGLAFLVDGNMAVAAGSAGGLMVRIDPADAAQLLARRGVEPMEMKGRSMKGWLHVDVAAAGPGQALDEWVRIGLAFARTLPARADARRGA